MLPTHSAAFCFKNQRETYISILKSTDSLKSIDSTISRMQFFAAVKNRSLRARCNWSGRKIDLEFFCETRQTLRTIAFGRATGCVESVGALLTATTATLCHSKECILARQCTHKAKIEAVINRLLGARGNLSGRTIDLRAFFCDAPNATHNSVWARNRVF